MKTIKLIRGSTIFLVIASILSCLQYIIGGYYIIFKETVNESLINEPLSVGAMSNTINNNTSGLDFAILGFPKCGTTFLRKVLGYHSDIAMGGRLEDEEHSEFCQIQHNDGVQKTMAWLEHERRLAETSSNQELPKQYGIKCPSMVRKPRAIVNLVKQSNEMRLVLGLRHPVRWFESMYNYRVGTHYRHNDINETIPHPNELLDTTKQWRDVSLTHVRYEGALKRLGEVRFNKRDMKEIKNRNISPHYKLFIYTTDQLHDTNETRRLQFQIDLQHHLRLKSPLVNFTEVRKTNAQDSSQYKQHISICDDEYRIIRNKLIHQGRITSDWIRNTFLESSDNIIVSDMNYFSSLLREWGVDPCRLRKSSITGFKWVSQ